MIEDDGGHLEALFAEWLQRYHGKQVSELDSYANPSVQGAYRAGFQAGKAEPSGEIERLRKLLNLYKDLSHGVLFFQNHLRAHIEAIHGEEQD